jgi:intracellular multiplication protein IcmK
VPEGPGPASPAGPAADAAASGGAGVPASPDDGGPAAAAPADPAGAGAERAEAQQEAYERSLRELLPASPEQIRVFRERADSRERALADPPPAAIRTRTVSLSLEPGFTPPAVVLTPNLVTALVLLDSSGSPWPVSASVLGSSELFTAEVIRDSSRNRVVLSPLTSHGSSNLVLALEGHDIPLVLRLETRSGVEEGRSVDGLVIYQVRGRGPLAAPELTSSPQPGPVSADLYGVLDGIRPEGSTVLQASPPVGDTDFIRSGDTLYVRTRHALVWPASRARVSGAGGWTVFEAPLEDTALLNVGEDIRRVTLARPDDAG